MDVIKIDKLNCLVPITDEMKRLLYSWNLAFVALENHNVFKEHVSEALFQSAVVTYFSVIKDTHKGRALREMIINPSVGTKMFGTSDGRIHPKDMKSALRYFEELRDKNISHMDRKRRDEQGTSWLRIPPMLTNNPERLDYVQAVSYYHTNIQEKNMFNVLVTNTILLLAQDILEENPSMSRLGENS